jgi:hypothetical protein
MTPPPRPQLTDEKPDDDEEQLRVEVRLPADADDP